MNDLYITTPLDQAISVEMSEELTIVDSLMRMSVHNKNLEMVYNYCRTILGDMKKKGLCLSKVLWALEQNWENYEVGDNFLDTTNSYTGLHRHTIERYVKVWQMLKDAPQDVVPELQQQSIKSLIPIAHAVSQGYEIEDDTWKKLASAPDYNTVSHII